MDWCKENTFRNGYWAETQEVMCQGEGFYSFQMPRRPLTATERKYVLLTSNGQACPKGQAMLINGHGEQVLMLQD